MARNQKNFNLFTYVDDTGRSWNLRGEDGGAAAAVDGHTTFDAAQPRWHGRSKRFHPRKIIYLDSATNRTISPVFYTGAAYAAVSIGATLAVQVTGLATTVNYEAVEKIPEKLPRTAAARQLPDS